MPGSQPRRDAATAATPAEDVRRGRLPAWRDVRQAVAEAHKLDEVYAVELRPGSVIRLILKIERRDEQPKQATTPATGKKENARTRKGRERKDAFHEKKRREAAAEAAAATNASQPLPLPPPRDPLAGFLAALPPPMAGRASQPKRAHESPKSAAPLIGHVVRTPGGTAAGEAKTPPLAPKKARAVASQLNAAAPAWASQRGVGA